MIVQNKNRKPNRLKNYDYSRVGAYFITICVHNRECLLGYLKNEEMILLDVGRIANDFWLQIPNHFPGVELGEFIVMPNHIHGIIIINQIPGNNDKRNTGGTGNIAGINVGNAVVGNAYMRSLQQQRTIPETDRTKMLIPKIVQQYKAAVSRDYHQLNPGQPFCWQKSYYDHIIRDQASFERISHYIIDNPLKWAGDIINLTSSEEDQIKHFKQLFTNN